MTITKTIAALGLSAAFAVQAHPVSPESMVPAPVREFTPARVTNPDYLPLKMIVTADMAANFVSDYQVIREQRNMLNASGLKAGECGTLLLIVGRSQGREATMISQTFSVTAGLSVQSVASGNSAVADNYTPEKWLNAYDYAYRLPTKTITALGGVPVSISIGKLKTCP